MDFGGQSEGGSFRPMCDGAALRDQSLRMMVRIKAGAQASSRVAPQDGILPVPALLLGQVFYLED